MTFLNFCCAFLRFLRAHFLFAPLLLRRTHTCWLDERRRYLSDRQMVAFYAAVWRHHHVLRRRALLRHARRARARAAHFCALFAFCAARMRVLFCALPCACVRRLCTRTGQGVIGVYEQLNKAKTRANKAGTTRQDRRPCLFSTTTFNLPNILRACLCA